MVHEVRRNAEESRYELLIDGKVAAVADYRADGDVWTMPHTVVDRTRRGQGLGAAVVRGALDDAREQGATVIPTCWFVAEFIESHPDYADLLAS
jgi:uncharacterized protein